jgi:uncharacterized protein YgfB (UPF0149 family)
MMNKENEKIELTISEIEKLTYDAVRGALKTFFNGLAKAFFDRWDRDFETIVEDLEYIKRFLQTMNRNKKDNDNEYGEYKEFDDTPVYAIYENMHKRGKK